MEMEVKLMILYVEDIARCNIAAAKSDIKLGYYNVGTENTNKYKTTL